MDFNVELDKIKKNIANMSEEEFDNVLLKCGIEIIKPSIESDYVKCLNKYFNEREYKKQLTNYQINEEYFEIYLLEQEVA